MYLAVESSVRVLHVVTIGDGVLLVLSMSKGYESVLPCIHELGSYWAGFLVHCTYLKPLILPTWNSFR